jgi:galactofuranosylgalactofuranosylrhamnosyl-N-acetylglucosaminyl-diphospho-decaprenol beta-1,5/1,6-galactofuranosyltransferase
MDSVLNPTLHTLQSLVLPNLGVQAPEDLYVRLNDQAWCRLDEPTLHFEAGGLAWTDTYYGALSVSTWRRHCALKDVLLQVEGEGRFVLSLGLHRHAQAPVWVAEQEVALQPGMPALVAVPGWDGLPDGLLFFRLRALEPGRLTAARYVTPQPPPNAVRLGLVVTHFNRVAQVLPAVERIRCLLRRSDLRGRLTLTVVDNSRNLPLASDAEVTVIPNQNLGGTGGFVRGMLSLIDGGTHTHALFMDDDASCETESIARALALLSYARTPRLAVTGALISESRPWQLLENGARFDGYVQPIGIGRDLRHVQALLDCDRGDPRPDYGAWWFFAFGLADMQRWPFPFFVRGDDIFFGLHNEFEIITTLGIACQGEDFHVKAGPMTAYLDARYHLVWAVLLQRGGARRVLKLVRELFIKALKGYQYASARAVTLALRHVAAGPRFFRDNMDLAQVRAEIAGWAPVEKMVPLVRLDEAYRLPRSGGRESKLRRLLRLLTLQGYLLPRALLSSKVLVHEKSFHGRARDVFGFRRVLYRHVASETGYMVELDRGRFFSEMRDMLAQLRPFLRRLPELRQAYAEAMEQMGCARFWRGVYGLNEGPAAATARPVAGGAVQDAIAQPARPTVPVTPST